MIIEKVTKKQIEAWKALYREKKKLLRVNRITGEELQRYFVEKYHPEKGSSPAFEKIVYLNAVDEGEKSPEIVSYTLKDDIFVGMELKSGSFHVECEDKKKMIPIWDDLFVQRGLSLKDIENFVIAAQYLVLTEKCEDIRSCYNGDEEPC